MSQAHIKIFGFVQGVGFRQFVKQHAQQHGVTGWVKNTSHGTVEAVFQGSKEKIGEMITLCKKGPMLAKVERVKVGWEEPVDQFSEFTIL